MSNQCNFKFVEISGKGSLKFTARISGKPAKSETIQIISFKLSTLSCVPKRLFHDFNKLQKLDLEGQEIKVIYKNTFEHANHLNELKLTANELSTIKQKEFHGAHNLKKLFLGSNKIENLHPDCFQGLKKLEILELQNNHLEVLDSKILEDLGELKKLDFSQNKIIHIPENVFNFNFKLIHINFAGNQILSASNKMFHGLVNLKVLTMKSNDCIDKNYTDLESEVGRLEDDLRTCLLAYKIREIFQSEIFDLKKLMEQQHDVLRNIIEKDREEDNYETSIEKIINEKSREDKLDY
jgi:hypothetical protein